MLIAAGNLDSDCETRPGQSGSTLVPGVVPDPEGGCTFTVLAPGSDRVTLCLYDERSRYFEECDLAQISAHAFQHFSPGAIAGMRYGYRLNGKDWYPDPWSRYQPAGIHAPSEIIDPGSYAWRTSGWSGRPYHQTVLYEIHVGSFTPEGTYLAAAERLKHIAGLGFTAILLMPLVERPWPSWGYDGVYPFAPCAEYGRPDDLKFLIDEAHGFGLQVFLDVVFNHFGPEGNYLCKYNPDYLSRSWQTPWGAGLNYDGEGRELTRELVLSSALFWLEEYRFDGLRIDSPGKIYDGSEVHILREMSELITGRCRGERHVHLLLENDHHAAYLQSTDDSVQYAGAFNLEGMRALNRSMITLSAEERAMQETFEELGRALCAQARDGEERFPAHSLDQLLFGYQNHDQVGNTETGHRLQSIVDPARIELALALVLLGPQIPFLFMGDEFGSRQSFPFFCRYADVSQDAVLAGRVAELELDPEKHLPPFDPDTYTMSKLDWPGSDPCARGDYIQLLLDIRRNRVLPMLENSKVIACGFRADADVLHVTWEFEGSARLDLLLSTDGKGVEVAADVIFSRTFESDDAGQPAVYLSFSIDGADSG